MLLGESLVLGDEFERVHSMNSFSWNEGYPLNCAYPRHVPQVLEKTPRILLLRLAVEYRQGEGKEYRPAPHHQGEDHAHEGDALLVRLVAQDHERLRQVLGKSPVRHALSGEDPKGPSPVLLFLENRSEARHDGVGLDEDRGADDADDAGNHLLHEEQADRQREDEDGSDEPDGALQHAVDDDVVGVVEKAARRGRGDRVGAARHRRVNTASTSAVKHLWVHFDARNAEPSIACIVSIVARIAPANDLKYFFMNSSLSCV